ncbi:MAG: MmgE/PrpD family protein, partial [Thaumarchaeota archaeon]|nr:MmgE/PrpD family protein [Nitrososphaerota archaeon]
MISDQIAKFVCTMEFDDIPHLAVENAKRSILDCVGVSLAGALDPNVLIVKNFVSEMGGKEESTILGDSRKIPAVNAALVNGVAAHALDYDDTSWVMLGHPSAISCPPAFAVGERQNSTGKEVLAAYILGGEVACRLGAALTERHYKLGWHNTGTVGTFGATVTAGKLFHLNQEEMTNAIGIAASMAGGIKKNFGTSCKPYHAGQASSNGVRAAILAKDGFNSSQSVFEGQTGFVQLFSGAFEERQLTELIGHPFVIADPGYSLKKYPSCAFTHSAIDCVLQLMGEQEFSLEDSKELECGCSQGAVDTLPYGIAQTGLQGKFSMPFCLAIAILNSSVSLEHFSDGTCRDPQVIELEKKVKLYVDPELTKRGYDDYGSRVKIVLKDGRELRNESARARGDSFGPQSEDVVKAKFDSCAAASISKSQKEDLANSILSLEKISNIRVIMDYLSAPKM